MTKKLLLLCAAVLLLAGCGWKGSGTVSSKYHKDAYSTQSCSFVSKIYQCHTTRYDERWVVSIRDDKGDYHDVDVNRGFWDAARNGDFFDNKDKK